VGNDLVSIGNLDNDVNSESKNDLVCIGNLENEVNLETEN